MLWLALGFVPGASHATTVRQPSFGELARGAEQVVHGEVTEVRAYVDPAAARPVIRTEVVLRVVESIGGGAKGETLRLRFLGGEVDGKGMRVSGMPNFRRGEETVLFVRGNGRAMCPLVGWRYGHFLVERETATQRARVVRTDGMAVTGRAAVETPMVADHDHVHAAAADLSNAMDVGAFLDLVRQERAKEVMR